MILKRKGKAVFLFIFLIVMICACGRQREKEQGNKYAVYYVNYDETGIYPQEYVTETTDTGELLTELLDQLHAVSEKLEYKAPLSDNITLLDYSVAEDQLTLNFDDSYRYLPVTTEVLVRAAIVRTLTQIEGIQYVSFQIRTEPLLDASGAVIGIMSADLFIDNAGNEINTYEKVKLKLYLANEAGDGLTTVSRSVVYSSNISMERLVLEQLIAGPVEGDKAFPTINPATKIISVNVKDGICYVDLDNTFLTQLYNVTSDVTIYSITNSLVELPNINKVQMSIDGDSTVNYKENTSFSTVFERNLELVE
ncbi:GerMN domain-containing protein [Parablautia intestinalis]|uniref:GerMN domain-containing protein n=1 Tax=Parablautia intestinalis TaxID=2320100 RepID=UPI00259D03AD|nr:GerMN domain-containing protein [Parablautia intestinalis]